MHARLLAPVLVLRLAESTSLINEGGRNVDHALCRLAFLFAASSQPGLQRDFQNASLRVFFLSVAGTKIGWRGGGGLKLELRSGVREKHCVLLDCPSFALVNLLTLVLEWEREEEPS